MATLDISSLPATITIENVSDRAQRVQMYKETISCLIEPGDKLKVEVSTSAEYLYFTSLARKELSVSAE